MKCDEILSWVAVVIAALVFYLMLMGCIIMTKTAFGG